MKRLGFEGKQGDGLNILGSDLWTQQAGEPRGIAPSNYEPSSSDNLGGQTHELRDKYDVRDNEG